MGKDYAISYDFINDCRKHLSTQEFIEMSEQRFFNQIESIADEAIDNGVRLIRLAGPSGSGKTTSTKRIVETIRNEGIPAYYMSMDNWYKTLSVENMPKTEDGDPDYESPELLDVEGFKEDVESLLNGEIINLREFDFTTRTSSKSTKTLSCEPNAILVIEGLHAINPMFDTSFKDFKVYVEPFNVEMSEDDDLTSSEIRLCRRMHRDMADRGMTFEATIQKCRSVDKGQSKYIAPYTRNVDILRVDTLLMYEIFIHKNELPDTDYLEDVETTNITKDMIPENSILREFYK